MLIDLTTWEKGVFVWMSVSWREFLWSGDRNCDLAPVRGERSVGCTVRGL